MSFYPLEAIETTEAVVVVVIVMLTLIVNHRIAMIMSDRILVRVRLEIVAMIATLLAAFISPCKLNYSVS